MMDFPLDAVTLLSVPGITLWTALWVQVMKKALPDSRLTPFIGLGWAILSAVGLQVLLVDPLTAQAVVSALLIGTFGGFGATFGYEGIQNARGIAGRGPRA